MSDYSKYKIVTFNDTIGRTCFGELIEETETTVVLNTPASIMVTPTQDGQMKVDVIPLFFAEFIEPDSSGSKATTFTFNKNSITVIDVNITEKILDHYFTKINVKELPATDGAADIKLFE